MASETPLFFMQIHTEFDLKRRKNHSLSGYRNTTLIQLAVLKKCQINKLINIYYTSEVFHLP